MDKNFNNMDERFKKIEEELSFQYDKSMWNDVNNLLDNQEMDEAFIQASNNAQASFIPNLSNVDDIFLDDAFKSAAENVEAEYSQSYFQEFLDNEADLTMDESFHQASLLSSSPYHNSYWKDADIALQNEGLHYEYKKEYWKDAEKLLDNNDRKTFFYRWSVAATILLLLSFAGLKMSNFLTNDTIVAERLNQFNKNSFVINPVKSIQSKSNITSQNSTNNELNADFSNHENQTNFNQQSSSLTADLTNSNSSNNNKEVNPEILYDKSNVNNSDLTNKNDENKTIDNDGLNDNNLVLIEQFSDNKEKINIEKIKLNTAESIIRDENAVPQIEIIDFSSKLKPNHSFGIKASKGIGRNYNQYSYTNLTPRNSFYFDYRFKPYNKLNRFEFGADLGLYHISLTDYALERSYSVHDKEGSVTHYWYKMVYQDLIFLSSNVQASINFNKNSKIKFGVGVDKYLTSRIDLQYSESNSGILNLKENNWGVNKGIQNFDFNVLLGYEHDLNRKISFLMDTRFGIFDKTNNGYFNSDESIREVSIQIGFRYNIFTKL